EAIRPRWPQQRTVVVGAQRRIVKQAVVERQLGCGVIAHRCVAVANRILCGLPEPVHLAAVVLLVHRVPGVRWIGGAEARELERIMLGAHGVRLEVTGWRSKAERLDLWRVAVI